jgi:TatD DNase family protein
VLDSHCHLDFPEFDADRAELVAEARRLGIDGYLVPGVHEGLWPAQDALAGTVGILFAVGLHPWWLSTRDPVDVALARLEQRVRARGAIAIGECGLDAKRPGLDLEVQSAWLEAQLALARALELPVILHQVGARTEFLRALERGGPLRRGGVVHAFSGDVAWARALLDRGFYLGFGAAVSAPKRQRLREALLATPAERVLLETDAPASSQPGTRSVPADLVSICRQVAEIRGASSAELARQSDANLARLLDR